MLECLGLMVYTIKSSSGSHKKYLIAGLADVRESSMRSLIVLNIFQSMQLIS